MDNLEAKFQAGPRGKFKLSDAQRQKWEGRKREAMKRAMFGKFTGDPDCREALLATKNRVIVEATSDKEWGAGTEDYEGLKRTKEWRGQNLFGQCLMEVRDSIRNPEKYELFELWDFKREGGEWMGPATRAEMKELRGRVQVRPSTDGA